MRNGLEGLEEEKISIAIAPISALKDLLKSCEMFLKMSLEDLGFIRTIQNGEQAEDLANRLIPKILKASAYGRLVADLFFSDGDIENMTLGFLVLSIAKDILRKEFPNVRYVQTDDGVLVLKEQGSQAADHFHETRILNTLLALKEITELDHEARQRANMPRGDFANFITKANECINRLKMREEGVLRNHNFIGSHSRCIRQCEELLRNVAPEVMQLVYAQPANVNGM